LAAAAPLALVARRHLAPYGYLMVALAMSLSLALALVSPGPGPGPPQHYSTLLTVAIQVQLEDRRLEGTDVSSK